MNTTTKREGPVKLAFFDTKPYDREYFDTYKSNYNVEPNLSDSA
jgi:hypothetical protein